MSIRFCRTSCCCWFLYKMQIDTYTDSENGGIERGIKRKIDIEWDKSAYPVAHQSNTTHIYTHRHQNTSNQANNTFWLYVCWLENRICVHIIWIRICLGNMYILTIKWILQMLASNWCIRFIVCNNTTSSMPCTFVENWKTIRSMVCRENKLKLVFPMNYCYKANTHSVDSLKSNTESLIKYPMSIPDK